MASKKLRLLHLLLLLSSLMGYLAWGGDNSAFLVEVEITVFKNLFSNPFSVAHPLIVIPILGQLLLLWSVGSKRNSKLRTFVGIGCIALLFLLIFVVGIVSKNLWISASTLPFFVLSVITIRHFVKLKP